MFCTATFCGVLQRPKVGVSFLVLKHSGQAVQWRRPIQAVLPQPRTRVPISERVRLEEKAVSWVTKYMPEEQDTQIPTQSTLLVDITKVRLSIRSCC